MTRPALPANRAANDNPKPTKVDGVPDFSQARKALEQMGWAS